LIDDEDPSILASRQPVFRKTGDLVENSNGFIKIIGRTNDSVKRFGIRTNLKKIEAVALSFPGMSEVSCVFHDEKLTLFFKIFGITKNPSIFKDLKLFLRKKLKDHEIPDECLEVQEIPLTSHGKVSKTKLINRYLACSSNLTTKKSPEFQFLEVLQNTFGQEFNEPQNLDNPKKLKSNLHNSFKSIGGTSMDALKIVMSLEEEQKRGFPDLIGILLDDSKTLYDAWKYLKDFLEKKSELGQVITEESSFQFKFNIQAQFDLKKCVDATPTFSEELNLVSVGTHSHLVATLSGDLEKVSMVDVGDRVEGQVSFFKTNQGVVGCYDGFLYCFDLKSGKILWKFDSGGMIKSKILIDDDLLIFGNYSDTNNLWCLDCSMDNPSLKWNVKIGGKGILAGPLKLDSSNIFVATLDGTLSTLNLEGASLWTRKLDNPVFSNPSLIPGSKKILVAEVSNHVHCYNFEGIEIWKIETGGNIFSSFEFQLLSENKCLIFFGCHDRQIYCLFYNLTEFSVAIRWKVELQSQIFATPRKISLKNRDFLVVFTTNGHLNLIDLDGCIKEKLQLPGEVFSTPAVHRNKIFVGCRNNFLYLIEIKS
jgi:acyl-CoA synthetase